MRYGSFVLVMTILGGAGGPQPTDPVCRTFFERVADYVALHRRLEGPLPQEVVTDDLEALLAPRPALAAAMRAARANARQGEIFPPAVAGYFRILVADALRHGGVDNMLAIVEDDNAVHVPVVVNGDYPAGRALSTMPACLLAELPELPAELQYRFVGRDLILWDVGAGLIVDIVPNAIPGIT